MTDLCLDVDRENTPHKVGWALAFTCLLVYLWKVFLYYLICNLRIMRVSINLSLPGGPLVKDNRNPLL